jgi:hypothetical protein
VDGRPVTEDDRETVLRSYLEAFEARDLARCLQFFAEDATIGFHVSAFRGRRGVEEWHRARFAAEARVVRIDRMTIEADRAVVDAVATSRTLEAWKVGELKGRVRFFFEGGRIVRAEFALRGSNPGLLEV